MLTKENMGGHGFLWTKTNVDSDSCGQDKKMWIYSYVTKKKKTCT